MFDSTFMGDVREPFNTRRFAIARSPVEGFAYTPAKPNRPWESRNHWMIKSKSHNYILLDYLEPDVRRFCQKAIDFLRTFRLPLEDRYLYLTVGTLSEESMDHWHSDGIQGSEVPSPGPGSFQFFWCDQSPVAYADQKFQTKGLNRHDADVSELLANQVHPDSVKETRSGMAHLISPYQIYRPALSTGAGSRKMLRLLVSYHPITSTNMTLNPLIEYDYPIHTTSEDRDSGGEYLRMAC